MMEANEPKLEGMCVYGEISGYLVVLWPRVGGGGEGRFLDVSLSDFEPNSLYFMLVVGDVISYPLCYSAWRTVSVFSPRL